MTEELISYTNIVETTETDSVSRIIVVRHGESIANTEGIYQGQTYDTDLSDLGKRQASALGARARELGIKRIIASPLRRTYQTALEISRETDLPIEIDNLIIETNHGDWEGKHKDWIKDNYNEIYTKWFENPLEVSFPKGESFLETCARVEEFIGGVLLPDTLIVTHDNIIRILAAIGDDLSIDQIWNYEIEPAALNFFEINNINGKSKLKTLKLNSSEHLKDLRADLSKHAL